MSRTLCGCWQYLDGNEVGLLDYEYGEGVYLCLGSVCFIWPAVVGVSQGNNTANKTRGIWVSDGMLYEDVYWHRAYLCHFFFFFPRIDSLRMFRKPDKDWVAITRLSKMPDNHCLSTDTCLLGAYASFPFRILEHRSDSRKRR